MKNISPIEKMYTVIDQKETDALVNMMTSDAVFVFGNIPPVKGKEEISGFLNNFFTSIQSINHSNLEWWQHEEKVTVKGNVTYTRHNGTKLSVPFAVILKMDKDLIDEYYIFADTSELYS